MMLQCCAMHAVLCQSSCNTVGLDFVISLEQQSQNALQWAWMLNSSVMLWWTNAYMSQQC